METDPGATVTYSAVATVGPGPEVSALLDAAATSRAIVRLRPGRTPEGRIAVVVGLQATTVARAVHEALAVLASVGLLSPATLEVLPTTELEQRRSAATNGDLVSVSEAARVLGISRQAVLGRIRSGALPARMIGSTYAIARSALHV